MHLLWLPLTTSLLLLPTLTMGDPKFLLVNAESVEEGRKNDTEDDGWDGQPGPGCPLEQPKSWATCSAPPAPPSYQPSKCKYGKLCCCGSCSPTVWASCDQGRWLVAVADYWECSMSSACKKGGLNISQ